MIRSAAFALPVLLGFASMASGQDVAVRSGEHDTYTRLVIDLPEARDWTIDAPETGIGARVRISGPPLQFDTSDVFDRIDTKRLAAVSARDADNTLALGFNCDCGVRAFRFEGRMLVLDIAEDAPKPTRSASAPAPAPATVTLPAPYLTPAAPAPSPAQLARTFVSDLALPDPDSVADAARNSDTDLFEERLIRQIAQAATQGLLEVDQDPPPDPVAAVVLDDRDDTLPEPDSFDPEAAFSTPDRNGRVFLTRNECPPPEIFGFMAPPAGDAAGYQQVIAPLRRTLYSEFDALKPEVGYDLAMAYLHFGFGAEARMLLRQLEPQGGAILAAVAAVLDEDPAPRSAPLHDLTQCDTPAALWSVLATPAGRPSEGVNTRSVLQTFDQLADHQKMTLGPRLIRALVAMGETPTAENLRIRLQRTDPDGSPDLTLAKAHLSRARGDEDEAEATLRTLARENAAQAPEAIVALFDEDIEVDPQRDADLVELTAALATEFEKTDEGSTFWRTNLRALAKSGQFDAAFALLKDAPADDVDLLRSAEAEVMADLVATAPDESFVKHALLNGPRLRPSLPPATVTALANRLVDIGFPDAARTLLPAPSDRLQSREQKLLSARIALATDDPEMAEIALIGLRGDEAEALRLQAREAMGDFGFAQVAHDAAGAASNAEASALAAGNWQRLRESDDPVLQRAADLALQPRDAATDAPLTLSQAEALLTDSADARSAITALLAKAREDTTPPEAPPQ